MTTFAQFRDHLKAVRSTKTLVLVIPGTLEIAKLRDAATRSLLEDTGLEHAQVVVLNKSGQPLIKEATLCSICADEPYRAPVPPAELSFKSDAMRWLTVVAVMSF